MAIVNDAEQFADWLTAARAGSFPELGRLLNYYRDYLLRVAHDELASDVAAKFAESDLVQETFLQATAAFPRFRGTTEAELRAWLRQILLNNLRDAVKFCGAKKRDQALEIPLDPDSMSAEMANRLPSPLPTPSEIWVSAERVQAVKNALARMSATDRIAIEMRSLAGQPFEELGTCLGRSAEAARKLWARAVDRLAHELSQDQSHG